MFTRKVRIQDWTILFLFSFDQYDMESIYDALLWVEAPDSIISQVSKNVYAGRLNEGFTFSEPSLRRTVFATGAAESGPEMLNSIVHEIMHISQHIAIEDGIDPLGEDICYLGGDLAGMVSDIVCELTCPHCSGR